ncbi:MULTISPECIES: hypothetical protein [Pseudomonas]|uniref:hypothetical protein n=1 Tax=Pseudomonas TaxID=286 RepID=UPI0021474126|nr:MULTISPECIES: hypothetical protein [Pseudomonas]UUT20961.1 hypothetical protein NRG23_25095 [Pseudomonas sp. T8]WJV24120.1 hypothetical protein PSR66_31630 [Pseudomonas chlororaphis]
MSAVNEYREALQRLISNKPINIQKGSAINKDTVALEAGRKRGSIKKSRPEHAQLILEIIAAIPASQTPSIQSQAKKPEQQKHLKNVARQERDKIKKSYEIALAKIVSLEHENHALRVELNTLRGSRAAPNKIIELITL